MPRSFSEPSPPPRILNKRRGVRMNSRVPVAIEWQEAGGKTRREQTYTRIIGPYGCLVVMSKGLSLEQHLRLVNLVTNQANQGKVVWKGGEQSEGCEVGIELTQPPEDFWGLDL